MANKMKKTKNTIKRIIGICLVVIILSGICALAANTKLNRIKIICSNNYEIITMTSKTKVSEILEDNHIIILPEQKVEPGLDEQITNGDTIKISSKTEEEKLLKVAQNTTNISEEEIKNAYIAITEKFVVEQEKIPFETITKDVSNSSEEVTNNVIQEGIEGIKEVTYKVKYQKDIEIQRQKMSESVIQEPVNKIIQIKAKATSRTAKSRKEAVSETSSKTTTQLPKINSKSSLAAKVEGKTPKIKTMNTSAYTASTCGKDSSSSGYGITSSGAKASSWYTIAAGKAYPIGTIIYIPYFQSKPNGGWFVVQDRGSLISNNRIDIYMGTYNECINFGRRSLECYIYN